MLPQRDFGLFALQQSFTTTFDVLHDAVDPKGLRRSIRNGLVKDGTYLCLDINCSSKLEGSAGTLGAFHLQG